MEWDSLLCDEQLALSPSSSPIPTTSPSSVEDGLLLEHNTPGPSTSGGVASTAATADVQQEERDYQFRLLLAKQADFLPAAGYVDALRRKNDIIQTLRYNAVKWVITARARLNFSHATTFLAVNYLDRFLSRYTHVEWEQWTMELVSIACLSIAAKFHEADVLSLNQIPMDDLSHSYEPANIKQMEMLILRSLDWRLNSITPYSYADLLTWKAGQVLPCHLVGPLGVRVVELLLGALLDVRFAGCFTQVAVAMAAVKRALQEVAPSGVVLAALLSDICSLAPPPYWEEIESCGKLLEDRVADPLYATTAKWSRCRRCPSSPVTVIGNVQNQYCHHQGIMGHDAADTSSDLELFYETGNGSSSSPSTTSTTSAATLNNKRRRSS